MKKYISSIFLFALLLTLGVACKSNKSEQSTQPTDTSSLNLQFLSKAEAEKVIIVDNSDGFFDKLTMADMSIQMRKAEMPSTGGEAKLQYQNLLKDEMMDFSEDEIVFMNDVFTKAKKELDDINPKLYPKNIKLIKTDVNHYGPDVYYTRDEAIVLPKNIFEAKDLESQKNVMLHEIFHILSRYNDDFRDEMYDLIGFKKYAENLVLPKEISNKLLTNPDGVRRDYCIHLHDKKGDLQRAVPLILSRKERYDPEIPSFFSYLNFDLFPLIKISENDVTLGVNQKGESSLSIEHNANFFELIKDNTTYIIHPDEIMAENFMLAVDTNGDENMSSFSPEGIELLNKVMDVLKSF